MAFTQIAPMYDSDGITVVNPGGTVLFGDVSEWDGLILELRAALEDIAGTYSLAAPTWTRGNVTTLRPDLSAGEDDGCYVSHIEDLRAAVNEYEAALYPSEPVTTWTDDPLTPSHDPRRAKYIQEIQAAVSRLQNVTISPASSVRVLQGGVEIGT